MNRVIGIIGGMGPEAGVEFQRRLIEAVRGRPDQDHLPVLHVSDPAIPDRTESLARGDETWVRRVLELGRKLEALGATEIVVCCITAHTRWKEIQQGLFVPLLNLVTWTTGKIKRSGCRRVALLATRGTIASTIFQREFSGSGITLVLPDDRRQSVVDDVIFGLHGVKRCGSTVENAQRLASVLVGLQNVDGVILGCTELSLLQLDVGMRIFDPLTIAARILSKEKPPWATGQREGEGGVAGPLLPEASLYGQTHT